MSGARNDRLGRNKRPHCGCGLPLRRVAGGYTGRSRENIEQLRSWGYAAEWITLRQARELEPDINPATIGDAPLAFSRET